MYRQTYLEINLNNLESNYNFLKKFTNKKIMAVVKANAYGIGEVTSAKFLEALGCDFFAVSSLDEAINLRNSGIKADILILGHTDSSDFDLVIKKNIIVTIHDLKQLVKIPSSLRVHLKIDTGLNRIGFKDLVELKRALNILKENNAKIEGIFSHYVMSDIKDHPYSLKQFELFKEMVLALDFNFKYIHIANSDGLFNLPEDFTNLVRPGLALLGYSKFTNDLKPVLALYSHISKIKKIGSGEGVSYNHRFISDQDSYLITVPIGYADGISRSNTNGVVYIKDSFHSIVGSVCMDQMMIESSVYYDVNTRVEIIGEHIDINKYASYNKLVLREVLTGLNDRITRKYYYNNRLYTTSDNHFNFIREGINE